MHRFFRQLPPSNPASSFKPVPRPETHQLDSHISTPKPNPACPRFHPPFEIPSDPDTPQGLFYPFFRGLPDLFFNFQPLRLVLRRRGRNRGLVAVLLDLDRINQHRPNLLPPKRLHNRQTTLHIVPPDELVEKSLPHNPFTQTLDPGDGRVGQEIEDLRRIVHDQREGSECVDEVGPEEGGERGSGEGRLGMFIILRRGRGEG
jgi:hypothetical protein